MVTFLHTADWQIGITRRWLQPEAQARFDSDRLEAVRACGRVAREQGCEFVLVAGDVFESNQLRQQTVLRALEAMADIALPTYLLPGNHDPLDAHSVYEQPVFRKHCPANVHVLTRPGLHRVSDSVELVAAPWRGKHPGMDPVATVMSDLAQPDACTRILVGHGAVDLLDVTGRNPQAIDTSALLEAHSQGLIDYVALGDRHSLTDVGGHGLIWYSGTPEVTDSREEAPGEVLVVSVDSGTEPEVTAHHVGRWTFSRLEWDVNSARDVDDLVAALHQVTDKERVVLKLTLRGVLDLGDYTQLTEVLESYAQMFAGLDYDTGASQLSVVPAQGQWEELGLSGFVAAAADDIRAQPDDGSGQDALALLFRLSKGVRG